MFLRPEMLLMNATCLPSGDHVLSPIACVRYSFSMLSGCTSSLLWDVICVGSVMTWGAEEVWDDVCAQAEMEKMSAQNNRALRFIRRSSLAFFGNLGILALRLRLRVLVDFNCGPGLISRMADIFQGTLGAFWLA